MVLDIWDYLGIYMFSRWRQEVGWGWGLQGSEGVTEAGTGLPRTKSVDGR